MADWHTDINNVLSNIPKTVFAYAYPDEWPNFESNDAVIVYRLANDVPAGFADDEEYEAQIDVFIDVWAKSPAKLDSIANEVKERLKSIEFIRIFNYDLYETETKLYHRTSRYQRVE